MACKNQNMNKLIINKKPVKWLILITIQTTLSIESIVPCHLASNFIGFAQFEIHDTSLNRMENGSE